MFWHRLRADYRWPHLVEGLLLLWIGSEEYPWFIFIYFSRQISLALEEFFKMRWRKTVLGKDVSYVKFCFCLPLQQVRLYDWYNHSHKENSTHATKLRTFDDFLGIVIVAKSFLGQVVQHCMEKLPYNHLVCECNVEIMPYFLCANGKGR